MEDAESKNHEEDIQKLWGSLISEKQLVTEFTGSYLPWLKRSVLVTLQLKGGALGSG